MYYATCQEQHYDPNAGTCAQVVWSEQASSLLPPMTTIEGLQIAGAISAVLAIAVSIKFFIKIGNAASSP